MSSPSGGNDDKTLAGQNPVSVVNRSGGHAVLAGQLPDGWKLLPVIPLFGVNPAPKVTEYANAGTLSRTRHSPMVTTVAGMYRRLPWLLRMHAW
jgi:hypothetical protein